MLGMMNAPLDNNPPEFYAENPGSSSNGLFGRKRSIISYLEDGRKLVNGEMENKNKEPQILWSELLTRTYIQKIHNAPRDRQEEK
uniref:Uncharacterized protein n=1 Tax=Acrobeloides nanus TaxID=290746 RepID=A0A914CHJ4_9BILA